MYKMAHFHPNSASENGQKSPITFVGFSTSSTLPKSYTFQNYPYSIYKKEACEHPILNIVQKTSPYNCSKLNKLWWWQPIQDSIPAQFLEASSMHGLKYVSQPKRHIIERVFWLISFLACVTGATLMISEIWARYYLNPVIVTFYPKEQDLNEIPFPAITICNINPFKKSTVEAYNKQYKEGRTEAERMKALDALRIINGICLTQESFLQTLHFAALRGKMIPEAQQKPSPELEKNLTQFLLHNSQPCSELLRYCVWGQEQYDCTKLFKPIITDYGKCCTFNMLPQELMESYHSVTQGVTMQGSGWTKKEIEEWKQWNYNSEGYILPHNLKFPHRQSRAGSIEGLSLVVDTDVDENFCPCTDSEGLKVLYHDPLEVPRVADLGLVVGLEREIYLDVSPSLTIANDDIKSFHHETRKCYFSTEYELKFFQPYTRSNCLEECWTDILIDNCSCVAYYAPRNSTTKICSTTPGTKDYNCVKDNERRYLNKLHRICSHCKYTCNELTYNAEITSAKLQSKSILWASKNKTKLDWTSHKLSVIHIFMGSDSTVPKFRQKLYQAVDLIANTGGLLGLYIGFSVLSAVEMVYFATMRVCCKHLRKSKKFGDKVQQSLLLPH